VASVRLSVINDEVLRVGGFQGPLARPALWGLLETFSITSSARLHSLDMRRGYEVEGGMLLNWFLRQGRGRPPWRRMSCEECEAWNAGEAGGQDTSAETDSPSSLSMWVKRPAAHPGKEVLAGRQRRRLTQPAPLLYEGLRPKASQISTKDRLRQAQLSQQIVQTVGEVCRFGCGHIRLPLGVPSGLAILACSSEL
jgi:hypothetical protein